jgi:hypothetical protein
MRTLLLLLVALPATAATIDLAGPDGTGFLSLSNVKSWASEPDPVTQSPYPYYFDSDANLWRSIAAGPLSAGSTYAEETSFTVFNKTISQSDFATVSAGTLAYDAAGLLGTGTESITSAALSFSFNNAGFSPFGSAYNTGGGIGNFGWAYVITTANVAGPGLTFTDGTLTSIDLTADISVAVRFADNPSFAWSTSYAGTLAITGDTYAFSLDVTQDNTASFLGTIEDTRMVFNRTGTIAAVSAVPEPAAAGALAGLCALVFVICIRRRSA